MSASFWWEQPGWLVLQLVLGAGLLALRRGRPAGAAGPGGSGILVGGLVRAVLVGAAAALVGVWLLRNGTSARLVLLGLLAVGGLFVLVSSAMRPLRSGTSPFVRFALRLFRLIAGCLLLVLLARPVWEREVITWYRLPLVVLLDQSESMALADGVEGQAGAVRAQRANEALGRAAAAWSRLEFFYDLRRWGVGEGLEPLAAWRVSPHAPLTGLVSALREAARVRSPEGYPPRAVLVVSDGAENVASRRKMREAAADLASQGTALLAFGVGPVPGTTPQVELEPLVLPSRLSVRDRLRIPVRGRVQACGGVEVRLELWWDAKCVETSMVTLAQRADRLTGELELLPESPGVHRVTVRVVLPRELGEQAFETSAVVNVFDDRIRVLQLEQAPRTEAAFIGRVLSGDPQVELNQRFLMANPSEEIASRLEDITWSDYDVVIVGRFHARLPDAVWSGLAEAVSRSGVAVLLAGGRGLFNDHDYAGTSLELLCPLGLVRDEFGLAGPVPFVPTADGLRHPILMTGSPLGDGRELWASLPPLGAAVLFGAPKPLATVLATDGAGHPLLAVQEVGRGRCLAAGWPSTWTWALASDEGQKLHRRFWRQMVLWLANRRPRAWVLTDEPLYQLSVLSTGRQRVKVRAGVTGLAWETQPGNLRASVAELVLIKGDERRRLTLSRRGEEWTAEFPSPGGEPLNLEPGEYELEFRVSANANPQTAPPADTRPAGDSFGERLTARTAFRVEQMELERRPPTSNLPGLRSAAEVTAPAGGGYYDIEALPEVLERLVEVDPRQTVRHRRRYSLVEQVPWLLLGLLAGSLVLEWAVRKRSGLP